PLEIDPATKPQESPELGAVVGSEISIDLELERVQVPRIAGRLRHEVKPRDARRTVDRKPGNRTLTGFVRVVHGQVGAHIERRQTRDARRGGSARRWAELHCEGGKAFERTGLE